MSDEDRNKLKPTIEILNISKLNAAASSDWRAQAHSGIRFMSQYWSMDVIIHVTSVPYCMIYTGIIAEGKGSGHVSVLALTAPHSLIPVWAQFTSPSRIL